MGATSVEDADAVTESLDNPHRALAPGTKPALHDTCSDGEPKRSASQVSASQQKTGLLPKSYRKFRRKDEPDEPPRFTIDLSLPPKKRYLQVCAALSTELKALPTVFEGDIRQIAEEYIPWPLFRMLCRILIRKVYDREENAELKGLSQATGLRMYLLVCFNVFLDLLMGCSSGAAAVRNEDDDQRPCKMVHFRTLDWDMEALRNLVVQLDFVTNKDGPVIATSITYAGYVGVLTGVKRDLSLSLNFRPTRIKSNRKRDDWKYYWHILMVLLGERPSISSTLRRFLLPKAPHRNSTASSQPGISYTDATDCIAGRLQRKNGKHMNPIRTPACYLCFCDGSEMTIFEKDLVTSVERRSTDFTIITNNDAKSSDESNTDDEESTTAADDKPVKTRPAGKVRHGATLASIIAEGEDRRRCAIDNWRRMRLFKSSQTPDEHHDSPDAKPDENLLSSSMKMSVQDVVELIQRYPTTNECTNFACIMDPRAGRVVWCRRWKKPLSDHWIREHANRVQDMFCLRNDLFFGS